MSNGFSTPPKLVTLKAEQASRPVYELVELLELKAGVPINYEDAEYSFAGELVDVTEKVTTPEARRRNPGLRRIALRPASLAIDLRLDEHGRPADKAEDIVLQMLETHHRSGNPVVYRSLADGKSVTVRVSKLRDVNGKLVDWHSPLDLTIPFPRGLVSAYDAALHVITELQKRGIPVTQGLLAYNVLSKSVVSFHATEGTAREALRVICLEQEWKDPNVPETIRPRIMSWQLLMDVSPGTRGFGLNIKTVYREDPLPAGGTIDVIVERDRP